MSKLRMTKREIRQHAWYLLIGWADCTDSADQLCLPDDWEAEDWAVRQEVQAICASLAGRYGKKFEPEAADA